MGHEKIVQQTSSDSNKSNVTKEFLKSGLLRDKNHSDTQMEIDIAYCIQDDKNDSQISNIAPIILSPVSASNKNDSVFSAKTNFLDIDTSINSNTHKTPALFNKNPNKTHLKQLASTPRIQDDHDCEIATFDIENHKPISKPPIKTDIINCFGFDDFLLPSTPIIAYKAKSDTNIAAEDGSSVTPPIGRTTKDPLKSNLDAKIQGNSLEISQNFEACNTKVYSEFVKFDASLTKMKDSLNTYQRLSTLNSKPSRFTYTDVYKKNVATNVNAWSVASKSIDREASCSFHNLRIKPNIGSALSNQNQYLENKVHNFNSDFPQSSENSKRISDDTDRLKVRSKEEKKEISKDSADIGGVTSSRNLEHGTKETVNKSKKESTVARPSKIEKQELIYETVGSKKQMKGASNAIRYNFRPI